MQMAATAGAGEADWWSSQVQTRSDRSERRAEQTFQTWLWGRIARNTDCDLVPERRRTRRSTIRVSSHRHAF